MLVSLFPIARDDPRLLQGPENTFERIGYDGLERGRLASAD